MRSFSFYDNHENTISHSKNNNGTILKKNSLECTNRSALHTHVLLLYLCCGSICSILSIQHTFDNTNSATD